MKTQTVTIRKYEENDENRCAEIVNSCVSVMDGLNEAARKVIVDKNSRGQLHFELSQIHTLVAESSGAVAGLGALSGNEVKRLYVDPKCQGSGVGKSLMNALEEEARGHGCAELITESSPSAVNFYERLGYQKLEEVSFSKGEAQFRCVRMRKSLKNE